MTRQMFIDYAIKNNPCNQDRQQIGFTPYDREELHSKMLKVYSSDFNDEKILDFCANVGCLYFNRTEIVSGDELTIDIRWRTSIEYWKDIDSVVNSIGQIENCSGIIEVYFISEAGNFYNHKHRLIAENEELFFEYLTTVEFDFHPIITAKTYEILSNIGWNEQRCVDTNDLISELKHYDITLTDAQLSFIEKFSGLTCGYKSEEFCFTSINEIINTIKNHKNAFRRKSQYKGMIWNNVISIGNTMSGPLSIDADGILLLMKAIPYGRTTMECIQHLLAETCDYYHLPLDPIR